MKIISTKYINRHLIKHEFTVQTYLLMSIILQQIQFKHNIAGSIQN